MILINGEWEQMTNLQDGIKIIEENLGKEFAQKFVYIMLDSVNTNNYVPCRVINQLYRYIGD